MSEQSEGQVSEVQRLDRDAADTPVSATDSVTGSPDAEAGDAPGGSAPDAVPPENQRDNDMKPTGRHRLGESIDQG